MSRAIDRIIPPIVRRSSRARVVAGVGPLTMLLGIAWGAAQPYRITWFDPGGVGVWYLIAVPPALVVLVGLLFHVFVALPLLHDLAEHEAER